MKNPLTSVGIEPATFPFVAQHLNHCATAVPKAHVIQCLYEVSKVILHFKKPPLDAIASQFNPQTLFFFKTCLKYRPDTQTSLLHGLSKATFQNVLFTSPPLPQHATHNPLTEHLLT